MKIRFLKPWGNYAPGETCEAGDSKGERLVKEKIAEVVVAKDKPKAPEPKPEPVTVAPVETAAMGPDQETEDVTPLRRGPGRPRRS